MAATIQELADRIIKKLKVEGFVIQRYDSMTTSSIYLKLDYGVCNSIRISDHRGKAQYQYRYNLILGKSGYESKRGKEGLPRYFYGPDAMHVMYLHILGARKVKMERYGARYQQFMEKNKHDKAQYKGFWANCWEV